MIIHLTPPSLTPDHIQNNISCIRAHRERLFRVDTELYNNKLIYHNYGQGGAGWTFLFGCVPASLSSYVKTTADRQPIAVIGAGCYGLLTAIMLTRKGHAVRIIAKETHTTSSHNAAGFFFPRPRKSSTEQERAVFESMGIASYTTYLDIFHGRHPFITQGATLLPAYFGIDIDPGFGPYQAQGLIAPARTVQIDFGNGKVYPAHEYQTLFINSTVLMQELWRNVQELGISVIQKNIESFDEIPEQTIFNCAGLGAKQLANDPRLVPVQGHLITLKNQPHPEQLQYLLNMKVVQTTAGRQRDELIYFAPKGQGILGITFIRGQADAAANQHEFDRLLERCREFFG